MTMNEPESPELGLQGVYQCYIASALFALTCLGIIVFIWMRVYHGPPTTFEGETMMMKRDEIARYLKAHVPVPENDAPPMFIPTGVVIHALEFKGPYTVQVAGYVWQKYADNLPPVDKGVVFPEAETTVLTKIYETHQGNETLIGWNFKTALREQFNYAQYPLDRQQIWLQMWHVDFEKDVYLEPDVDAYTTLEPSALPGLDPELILENWQFERSYFSYRLKRYNANFGIQGYVADAPQPELYFNVSIKRFMLSALIARGIAPLVILIQLFVIVMVIGSDAKRLEQFGVRPGAVIFTCAAFSLRSWSRKMRCAMRSNGTASSIWKRCMS
jgi:hypothetical protein